MPVIVNRRKHKISVNLGNGKRVVLSGGESAKIGDKQASSFGVVNAVNAREIAIVPDTGEAKSVAKAKPAEEKTDSAESFREEEKSVKSEKKTEKKGDSW